MADFEHFVTCGICLETFTDPKMMSCLHSFCSGCIIRLKRSVDDQVKCPICKQFTPSDQIKNDFKTGNLLEAVNKKRKSDEMERRLSISRAILPPSNETCDFAKCTQKASRYCIDCELKICTLCQILKHDEMYGNNKSKHQVVARFCYFNCRFHPSRLPKLYCCSCKTPLCQACIIEHSQSHELVDIGQFSLHYQKLDDWKSGARSFLHCIHGMKRICQKSAVNMVANMATDMNTVSFEGVSKAKEEVKTHVKLMENAAKEVLDEVFVYKNSARHQKIYAAVTNIMDLPMDIILDKKEKFVKLMAEVDAWPVYLFQTDEKFQEVLSARLIQIYKDFHTKVKSHFDSILDDIKKQIEKHEKGEPPKFQGGRLIRARKKLKSSVV